MDKMEMLLMFAVLVALAAAFMVLLCKKLGWAEYMQVHGDKYLSQLFCCDLCMSFWACFILSIILSVTMDNGSFMIIPIFATPIARQLV